jgi:hypothetical protein
MRRTELLQELRKMRFEEAYEGWNAGRLTREEACRLGGSVSGNPTSQCWVSRYAPTQPTGYGLLYSRQSQWIFTCFVKLL